MKRLWLALSLAVATLVITTLSTAQAQNYPNRPVRLLIPFAAGGAVDTIGRVIGQKLTEQMGQPVIVENRAGAAGGEGDEQADRTVGIVLRLRRAECGYDKRKREPETFHGSDPPRRARSVAGSCPSAKQKIGANGSGEAAQKKTASRRSGWRRSLQL